MLERNGFLPEEKAVILAEALPYIRRFSGKTVVIKLGGSTMEDPSLLQSFAEDVVLLRLVGIRPVVVHGGGPAIDEVAKRLGLEVRFVGGMRATSEEMMKVVQMVLGGLVNQNLVALLNLNGGRSVGLTGLDASLFMVRKMASRSGEDLGRVGQVVNVHPQVILDLEEKGYIPVVAPMGSDEGGMPYNINADTAAGALAASLAAEKLILLTNIPGVLDGDGRLLSRLDKEEAQALVTSGVISGGMLPKVHCALSAVESGVASSHILDGRLPHALLLEVFTKEGVGTLISRSES